MSAGRYSRLVLVLTGGAGHKRADERADWHFEARWKKRFMVTSVVVAVCCGNHRADLEFRGRMQMRPNKTSSEGEVFFGSGSMAHSRGVSIHREL